MLLVQEFLKTKTFGELAAEHGVYASFSKSGHKFSLNYDQIEAKEADPLAQECRGLVLSCHDGSPIPGVQTPEGKISRDAVSPGATQILAYPMKRFFNHGQGSAADIDWSDPNLAVLEKLDGTLAIVYFDQFTDKWCMATRSVPEADLFMDNGIFTFRTLFEKAVQETCKFTFNDLSSYLDKSYTYCFELTTLYNRIVVYYPTNGITLLAARNLKTLQEENPANLGLVTVIGVPVVQAHTHKTIEELVDWVSSLNPMEHEGVVVRDSKFNRIKVKNAAYVAYNKVRDAMASSPRNMVELILAEKDDDVIPMLPEELVKSIQKIKEGILWAIKEHDVAYKTMIASLALNPLATKKDFAMMVNGLVKVRTAGKLWTAPFFQMYDGKASNMKDFIMKSRHDGTWGNTFLDKMLELANNHSNQA
jgi:hypothetical protein